MNRFRKFLTVSVLSMSVLSMTVVFSPVNAAVAQDGDLIKMSGLSAVYYFKGGKRFVFPNEKTYFSWYANFNSVKTIPQAELESYPLGGNVTYRPGTKLVKITTNPMVYAVEPNGTLRAITSEAMASSLYGVNWNKMIDDVPDAFFTNYTTGAALESGKYPVGQVVNPQNTSDLYYWDGTNYRKFSNEAAFLANGLNFKYVVTVTTAITAGGTALAGAEDGLKNTAQNAATGPAVIGGSGLTVALAADTPAAATTVFSATAANGAQAFIPVLKVNFTAASDGAMQVNTLKFKRAGIPSADTDFADFYLYDGNTMLAKYNSLTTGVLTFTNTTTGLFSVPAGTTKAVTLKVNLDKDVAASRAYNFSILAATDVVSATGTVSGTFPINGNTMSTASVTDLGKLTVEHSANASNPDPGTTAQTLWKFKAIVVNQDVQIERLKFTIIGTVDVKDLANLKLDVGGTQIGTTVAALASDKTVTFDFATPYKIEKGNTKTISLLGDVVSGTSRTFSVYFYNKEDVVSKDLGYSVYLTPDQADTWTKIQSSADATINSGSLTVSRALTSPSGNVPLGATNVELGKFDMKATGEAIKVDSIWIYVALGSSADGLYQVKLFVDGSQIGTAQDPVDATATEVTLGNALIIPAGTTKTVVVKADMKDNDQGALTNSETLSFQLGNVKSTDYTKQSSGGTSTTGPVSANALTVKSGALTVAKNLSLADFSTTNPIGVRGATNVKVGSFILTAGAGEAVNVTQVVVGDDGGDTAEDFGDNFQNLTLKNGSTPVAATQGTLSGAAGADYTFSLTTSVTIAAGAQYVIDCYADILTSGSGFGGNAAPGLEFVSAAATGALTATDATGSLGVTNLHNIRIASSGTLTVTANASTPIAGQSVMGQTDVELARLDFTAGPSEDLNISRIEISDTTTGFNGSLYNVKFYDAANLTTPLGTVSSFDATNDVELYLPTNWVIPKDTTKTLVLKGSVNQYPNATSGGTVTLALSSNADIDTTGKDSGTAVTGASEVVSSATGNAQDIYRTMLTVVKGSNSPSGSSVASANATVLEITASANSNYDAAVNAVAITMSGTVDVTGTGHAKLYKSTDLNTALATESYKTVTGNATAGSTTTIKFNTSAVDAIPVGATVWVLDADGTPATGQRATITSIAFTGGADTTVTFTPAYTGCTGGVNATLTYFPLQPGTGKLYFGAQTTLAANLADAATTITVASGNTSGFALGDTVYPVGYDTNGTAVTRASGCVISAISATDLTVSACQLSNDATIVYDYLSGTPANAVAKGLNSAAIVYTGQINESVAAGSANAKTFVVKGDTTGAATNENLRADIAAVGDFNWDDKVTYGIITDTLNLPITGGTLTY